MGDYTKQVKRCWDYTEGVILSSMEIKRVYMKQLIAKLTLAFVIISVLVLPTEYSSAHESERTYVNIGIAFGSSAVSNATVSSDEGFKIIRVVSEQFHELLRVPDTRQLDVSIESGEIIVRNSFGEMIPVNFDVDTVIVPINFEDGGIITINNRQYRGGIRFFPVSGGRMNVINFVELEHYIAGVLHAEIGQGSPIEVIKAQAVATRSFTITNLGRHRNEGFDLCNSWHCQVYRGYADEFPSTLRATNETAGLVIKHGGVPVQAFYFANSGGHTQSSQDVWGGTLPHTVGVRDDFSPHLPWTYQITFTALGTRLAAAGHNVGTVQSVAITERAVSGAATEVEIRGSERTVQLRGERFRLALGASNVRSQMFSFDGATSQMPPAGATSPSFVISNGTTNRQINSGDTVHVMGANGVVVQRNASDIYITSYTLTPRRGETQQNGTSQQDNRETGNQNNLDVVTDGLLVIHGTGFGHGVGMAQQSAIEMARRGYNLTQILTFFYTDITVERL